MVDVVLKQVCINKYKSFLTKQTFNVEQGITRIVGKNESGKTAILEALAKFNYFEENDNFKFNPTFDYPKSEFIDYQRSNQKVDVIECIFEIDEPLKRVIESDCGKGVLVKNSFKYAKNYSQGGTYSEYSVSFSAFVNYLIDSLELNKESTKHIKNAKDFNTLVQVCTGSEELKPVADELTRISNENKWKWDDALSGYIFSKHISPNIPKFWYFDEYYTILSRIDLNAILNGTAKNVYNEEELNIINALFDLAGLKVADVVSSTDFEVFTATLEATSNKITDEMFEYWTTNKNLEIEFKIETLTNNQKFLNIRIKNTKHRVTLPLKNRSKGFIWFFSFLIWFSKIQGKNDNNYILLLDEPGLNLHAAAQRDLLRFIEEKLSPQYQVIYTTHSPFMIDPNKLNEIRTVFDSQDPKVGSRISNAIQEKDPDTLFPLQAALGYDIAQNLYISEKNLIVEGVSDLIYLNSISEFLKAQGKNGLKEEITIVPVGGLDKVASFISLLRGSKLNLVCLLDNFSDPKSKQRVDDLVKGKIVKEKNIRYFGEFAGLGTVTADLEDMFGKNEYLELFNRVFDGKYAKIKLEQIPEQDKPILRQINQLLKIERFNHYQPANEFLKIVDKASVISEETAKRFEKMFTEINNLL